MPCPSHQSTATQVTKIIAALPCAQEQIVYGGTAGNAVVKAMRATHAIKEVGRNYLMPKPCDAISSSLNTIIRLPHPQCFIAGWAGPRAARAFGQRVDRFIAAYRARVGSGGAPFLLEAWIALEAEGLTEGQFRFVRAAVLRALEKQSGLGRTYT